LGSRSEEAGSARFFALRAIFTVMGEKSKTEDSLYTYRATVTSVYDGDTITCTISLGFDIELKDQKIRLLGINAPEVRGEQRESGLVTRDRLREKIDGKQVLLKTKKDKKGKYGRWLGTIWLGEEDVNQWLLTEGLAKVYDK
jgi:micrococcal nuclease